MTLNNMLMDDFKGGMTRRPNRLNFDPKSVYDGLNVELAQGGVFSRRGSSISSTGSLPPGEIMALTQFRSPTTEQSYLVAQVKHLITFEEGGTSPSARANHSLVWDTGNGRALLFGGDEGGVSFNDLWAYSPTTKTWTELSPTGGPPHVRSFHVAIYVPSLEIMVVFAGTYWDGSNHWLNDVWTLDCQTDTWTEQSPTGTVPAAGEYAGVFRTATTGLVVYAGVNNSLEISELDLSTWNWSVFTSTIPLPQPSAGERWPHYGATAAAYDTVNDTVITVGGTDTTETMTKAVYSLSFDTSAWTRLADLSGTDYGVRLKAVYCSGVVNIIGDIGGTGGGEDLAFLQYSVVGNSWSTGAWSGSTHPVNRSGHAVALSDSGSLIVSGGRDPILATYYDDVWQTPEVCALGTYGYGLYASPTPLPTASGVFTQIYEFTSEPGVVTFGTLNDRVVITEGKSDVPLVWPGAMSADASDWPHVLHALIAQDGVRMYTIEAEVCDKDVDTVAQVGGIRRWGAIYICTDMPLVEGFYFDMETPNTGADGTTASTYHEPLQIDAVADVARQDLKDVITDWVQSAGATGQFKNTGAEIVCIGPGNYLGAWSGATAYVVGDTVLSGGVRYWCIQNHTNFIPPNLTYWRVNNPNVVPGIAVDLGDGEFLITAVTAGGYGAAQVTLEAIHATATVDAAYSLSVDTNGVTVNLSYQTGVNTWTKTLTGGNVGAGYSFRIVIPASEISASGDHVQLTFKGPTAYPAQRVGTYGFYDATTINKVTIVERDGSTQDGTTTPTLITFPGSYGTHVNSKELELNATVTTDVIPFTVDETKDYLVNIDMNWSTSYYVPAGASSRTAPQAFRAGYLPYVAGTSYYKDFGWGNDGNEAASQTVTGYSEMPWIVGLSNIAITGIQPVATGVNAAHTTDAAQIASGTWESLDGITITQATPGSSAIYHAASKDARATFWVFDAAAWRQIVRENAGAWQYNDSATTTPNWVAASTDTLLQALRQAFGVAQNQMTKAELEAITAAQWADWFVPHFTPTLDFAVGLDADGTDTPLISAYEITYGDTGQAIIEGFKDGAWTGGDGWTDNTIVSGNRLGQSGSILYDGATPFEADYHVVDGIPGYWFRLLTNGTSPSCAITRIRYKAPCQPLANIGNGVPNISTGVVFVNGSTGAELDLSVNMSEGNASVVGSVALPMTTDDHLYFGFGTRFSQVQIAPYADPSDTTYTNNQAASTAVWEYWNGEDWATLTVVDGTFFETNSATLGTKGLVSFEAPSDWKTNVPFNSFYSRGYWVRMSVSANLTTTFALSEVRIYGIPDPIKKHRIVTAFKDRIVLLDRPDAPSQADISREMAEYGFCDEGYAWVMVGSTDAITSAVSAWDGVIIGKGDTLHHLTSSDDGTISLNTVEAARHVPINSQVVVKAPVSGLDYGDRYGLYFINRYGGFVMTGLHTDTLRDTSRGKTLSDSFWDQKAYPHLELDYLNLSQGVYFAPKNQCIWAVPMRLGPNELITQGTITTETWTFDLGDAAVNSWTSNYSIRCTHHSADIQTSGVQVRVTFKTQNFDTVITHAAFAEVDLDNYGNAVGAFGGASFKELLFSGSSGFSITEDGGEITSDWLTFDVDPAKTYMTIVETAGTNEGTASQAGGIGDGTFQAHRTGEWNVPNAVTELGYSWESGVYSLVSKIEVRDTIGEVAPVYSDTTATTNNALIVYDLTMQAWLPPFTFPFGIASLCVAFHYNAYSRGHMGDVGLYAGDYEGRVIRLFDPAETDDMGTDIAGFIKLGYLNYGQPETEKHVRQARLYGYTIGTEVRLTTSGLVLRQGDTTSVSQISTFTNIAGATESGIDFAQPNVSANFLEYELDFDAYTEIEGIELGIAGLRNWPPTG